jgi:AcrR family transcriptional regulator
VVAAALELADERGLDALSMPALAGQLGCGVMTLYGYVDGKEDLLDAVAQRGLADIRLPRPLPDQPADLLVAWGRALRRTLLEHPSLPTIFLSRAVVGPGIFRGVEALLGRLVGAGMPPADGLRAVYAVLIYTAGFGAWEVPRTIRQPAAAYGAAWRQAFAALPPADFPLCAKVLDELARVADPEQFEHGLAALAAGLVRG